MTYVEWAQLLLPIGFVIGVGWRMNLHWKEFNRWLDHTVELL